MTGTKSETKVTQNKTRPTGDATAVNAFIEGIEHAGRKEDAWAMLELMQRLSGEPPVLWGPSIVGFGSYHYQYDSGREGDGPLLAFSPRNANMVVYIIPGFVGFEATLAKLGKHKLGKSCLYLGRLKSIDMDVLAELLVADLAHMRKKYNR